MAKPIIEMKDISYSYGQRNVIDHIHLTVEEGNFLALVGPNGSGKTTLLKCLAWLD